jgi:hypothetical protein
MTAMVRMLEMRIVPAGRASPGRGTEYHISSAGRA